MGCCKSKPKPKVYIEVADSEHNDTFKVIPLDESIPSPIVKPTLSEFQQQLVEKQKKYELEKIEIERIERQKYEDYFDLLVKYLQNELLRKIEKGQRSLNNYYVLAPEVPESKNFTEIPTWFKEKLVEYFKKENCKIEFDLENKTRKLLVSIYWSPPKQ